MNTRIYKGHYGWTAETSIPLDDTYALRFCTMKRSNGAVTTTASRVKPERGGYSFVMFQDFNVQVQTGLKSSRATEKTVADQHQLALAQLDSIKAACDAHYAKEAA